MPSWILPSDSHAPGDTGHTTDHNHIVDDLTLINDAVPVVSGGLTGATGATRYVGATASGAPASGTFAVGDFAVDQTGKTWVCTTAGSPGTWTQTGGGSLANTTDWINVTEAPYSADPTGSTDSTTAIQDAINAAQSLSSGGSKGAVVYFPAGAYKISSALSVTSENITLRGDGGGGEYNGNPVKISQTSTSANGLTVANAWNIILKGISFAGPGSGSGVGVSLQYTTSPSGFNGLEDVYITGFGSHGLYLEVPIMSSFTRVWAEGNGGYGIYVNGGTSCTFNSCWAPYNSTGGWWASGNYHAWNGCGADYNTGNGWTMDNVQGCNISGSGSEQNTGIALYFTGTTYACTVNGFWCSNKDVGLQIDSNCYRLVIAGFLEDPVGSPTYSISIAAGAIVTLINPQVTTAKNIASGGNYVNQIQDNGITAAGYLSVNGLTGAIAASRYAGATSSGAPASGTFAVGDFVIDQTGKVWICTTAGSPGTWTQAGASLPLTTLGDLLYENSTPAPARLAGNTTATKNFLTQTGTGSVSAAPAWGTIAAADVPGIQGVAVTSAEANLVADLNNATARTATATLLPGEETIYSGSTASQTLTLPATPPSSSVNTVTNAASVSVTLAPGSGATLSNFGTSGNITIPAGYTFAVVYIGTTWYVQSAGPSDFAKSNALAIANGGTGTSTGAPQNDVFAGPSSGGTGAPSFRALVAADLPAGTTSAKGALQLDGTASDIQALAGSGSAGSSGEAADAKHVHPNTGLVTSVTAGDTSIVVGGTSAAPTLETGTLDVIASDHPPAANWSNNSHKITSLANGLASTDAAAYGQTLGGGNLAPLTTAGDLLITNSTPAPARLPVGSTGQLLGVSGGLPSWTSLDATAADITAPGNQAAGAVGLPADSGHTHPASSAWVPADNGLLVANYAMQAAGTTFVALTAGTVYLVRLNIRQALTLSYLWILVANGSSGASSGSVCGLYSSSGTLLTGSSDVGTLAGGNHKLTLTTPQALSAGTFVWAALCVNYLTTQPSLYAWINGGGYGNIGQTATTYNFATNGPAATTVASGSNGGEISTIASWSSPSAGVLSVASTTGYPASGSLAVAASGTTLAEITYTGISGNTFTGCAYVSGSATGTVSTGGAVTNAALPASITPSSNANLNAAYWIGGQ
jgi:hypothetical protein